MMIPTAHGAPVNEGIMKKQARFWTYHKSGVVRIKLNPGQTLYHSHGGPTDEGYSRTSEAYTFDGRMVATEWQVDARDCDGRMTHTGSSYCAVDKLAAGYVDAEAGVAFPAWESGEGSQRDYSAEAMGY